jgi:hypothetical protein
VKPASSEKKTVTTPPAKLITPSPEKGKAPTPAVKQIKPATETVNKGKLNSNPPAKPVSAKKNDRPPSTDKVDITKKEEINLEKNLEKDEKNKSAKKTPISKVAIKELENKDQGKEP